VELLKLLSENKITSRVAKDLLPEVVFKGENAEALAHARGLIQENSEDALRIIVDQIIAENPQVVVEYKAGKESSIQYLLGLGMKITKGAANPIVLKTLLTEKLK
jgi:aspartyl-tRNA(Asn)/glutamyl-tRNA(Gln) amidotransferase subunit B